MDTLMLGGFPWGLCVVGLGLGKGMGRTADRGPDRGGPTSHVPAKFRHSSHIKKNFKKQFHFAPLLPFLATRDLRPSTLSCLVLRSNIRRRRRLNSKFGRSSGTNSHVRLSLSRTKWGEVGSAALPTIKPTNPANQSIDRWIDRLATRTPNSVGRHPIEGGGAGVCSATRSTLDS